MFALAFTLSEIHLSQVMKPLYKSAQTPKKFRDAIKNEGFPVIVMYTKKDCKECDEFIAKMQGPAEKVLGFAQVIQVNCDLNSSVQFCKDQKVKNIPAMKFYNQNDEFPNPVPWDFEEDLTDKSFIEWIYEHRKNIFSTSLKPEALLKYFQDEPNKNVTILYLTKGAWPAIFMNKVSIHFSGRAMNIHQASFDSEAASVLSEIPGAEVFKAGKNQIAVYAKDKFTLYSGEMKEAEVIQWIEENFYGAPKKNVQKEEN
ncbi:Thioredoxin_domain-containing protein [Hexamita inflata]|uniref:Thioredoxin_domain-containing protein n=1 Tax=Hexamita inflata TaxID=28002 RepID=A0ABP1GGY9_9EUKA